jgi:pimeloyl-ACP methyl ester carboxylesterase
MMEPSFGLEPASWKGLCYWDNKKNLPCILMLHNGGDTHAVWGHQIQKWSKTHRIVVPDLPGFGLSRQSENPGTLNSLVHELSSWIQELELQPQTVIGVCIGASIVLELARQKVISPEKLILVNLCIGYQGLSAGLRWFGKTLQHLGPLPLRFFARLPGVATQIANSTWHHPNPNDPVYAQLLRNTCAPEQYKSRHKLVTGLSSFDQWWQNLDSIPPHHLIWGERNQILSPQVARLVHQRLQTKSFHWMGESGHLPMAERPEEFCKLVESLPS